MTESDEITDNTHIDTNAGDAAAVRSRSALHSMTWRMIGGLTLLLLIALVAFQRNKSSETTKIQETKVLATVSSVVALGSIVPGNAVIHLNAPASSGEARLQSLFVHENDIVAKNQIIGTLDSIGRLKAAAAVARAQVAQEKSALDRVKAGNSVFQIAAQRATVERLRAEAIRQSSDIERYRALHAQGIVSESDWEIRSVAFDQATASLREAVSTLKQIGEVRPVDLSVAQTNLMSAKASLESAVVNVEQAYIRAPEDGRVLHIYTWPGERVGDSGVLDMAPTMDIFVEAEVYETDILRIHLGQLATITGLALASPIHGTVSLIERSIGRQQVVNTDPAANTDARVAIVRVRLDPSSRQFAERLINLQVRVEFNPE